MLWLLAPFIHTKPHPAPDVKWNVTFERREEMRPDGVYCSWEAESLRAGDVPIWAADPPEEHWCQSPEESARTVDVLGEDGPYLSVRLTEWGCCPEKTQVTACVTYDVRTGQPATLEQYDPDHYKWRSRKLAKVMASRPGWDVEPSAFIVGGGHVRVCAEKGGKMEEIPLR